MQSMWVIVVAAGSGSRFGRPKQFEELAGRPVLDWSVGAARAAAGGPGDGVVVVVAPGGAGDAEVIVVHDGARPLAGAELFARVVGAVRDGADAAVPAIDVTDTLRHRSGGAVDRNGLVAVQTP